MNELLSNTDSKVKINILISCSTITFNAMFEILYNQQYGHLSHATKDSSNCEDKVSFMHRCTSK